ncbi:hypothetical protein E1193_27530 [Micromonospora sp. KC606]|uniref:sensor histidine kinase n=1 Tax=Micromonospora sp. KC606 TaxID=2530379 RepID=UPI00104994EE|nr:ATP-binding protein [Micromonospora sp. KC606]TDC72523.1 hypothetical protein E1193_27530 [Micromonospora sp. KC606]
MADPASTPGRTPGNVLATMLRSMRVGIVGIVVLNCALSVGVAMAPGRLSTAGAAVLAAVNATLVITALPLLGASGGGWWSRWAATTVYPVLAALTVLVSIRQSTPNVGQRLPSDYALCAAGAVAAYRSGLAGHLGMCTLLGYAAVLQARAFGVRQAMSSLLFALCFYGLMAAVFWIVRTSAHRTERTIRRLAQAEQVALVTAAVRRDRVQRMRVLHDTVLATLTAVARGMATAGPAARARFAADLARLDRPDLLPTLAADWRDGVSGYAVAAALDRVCADIGVVGLAVRQAHTRTPPQRIAASSAEALVWAVSEALTNVSRHAGVTEAEVTLCWDERWVTARVRDAGRGFDPERLVPRIGLRESLGGRVAAVGGQVRLTSAVSSGTTVEIVVPVRVAAGQPVGAG